MNTGDLCVIFFVLNLRNQKITNLKIIALLFEQLIINHLTFFSSKSIAVATIAENLSSHNLMLSHYFNCIVQWPNLYLSIENGKLDYCGIAWIFYLILWRCHVIFLIIIVFDISVYKGIIESLYRKIALCFWFFHNFFNVFFGFHFITHNQLFIFGNIELERQSDLNSSQLRYKRRDIVHINYVVIFVIYVKDLSPWFSFNKILYALCLNQITACVGLIGIQ